MKNRQTSRMKSVIRNIAFFAAVGFAATMAPTQANAQGAAVSGFFDTHTGMNEKATGTAFHRELYTGYRDLSKELRGFWNDSRDAELFNHKARSAGREAPVYPDEVRDRNVGDQAPTFQNALYRLKTVFERGGRHLAAQDTARAQVSYDCWIEAVEARKTERAAECKARFDAAMSRAEAAANLSLVDITRSQPIPMEVAQRPPVAPAPPPVEYKPVPQAVLDQYMRVHFDFDSVNMTASGRQDFQTAVAALREYPQLRINVIAHADRAGTAEYNKRLSQRRADAVLTAFAQAGIDLNRVDVVEAVGESRPMVPTADGVPHPENRVAELKLKIGR